MNKPVLFFFILWASTSVISVSYAQQKENIFKRETPITWLGVDFSEARYMGEQGTVSTYEMKTLYPKINYLILSEPAKYHIAKSFDKYSITNNLQEVEERHRNTEEGKIISYNYADFNRFTADSIKRIVGQYKLPNTKGTALVFIVEALNKSSEKAAMWVTFINAETKSVIFTARMTGKAGGIGFRNHWAAPVAHVLKQIYTRDYKNWQRSYNTQKN